MPISFMGCVQCTVAACTKICSSELIEAVSGMNNEGKVCRGDLISSAWITCAAMGCLALAISGCTRGVEQEHRAEWQADNAGAEGKSAHEFVVDVVDFIKESGLEPTFPQLWIFDGTGRLISTERSYMLGKPLNMETESPGPVFSEMGKLEKYLTLNAVQFNRWSRCGADYCVVMIAPDASLLADCEPCKLMQSQLDEYFSSRGSSVAYRTVLLTNKIPPSDRVKGRNAGSSML